MIMLSTCIISLINRAAIILKERMVYRAVPLVTSPFSGLPHLPRNKRPHPPGNPPLLIALGVTIILIPHPQPVSNGNDAAQARLGPVAIAALSHL